MTIDNSLTIYLPDELLKCKEACLLYSNRIIARADIHTWRLQAGSDGGIPIASPFIAEGIQNVCRSLPQDSKQQGKLEFIALDSAGAPVFHDYVRIDVQDLLKIVEQKPKEHGKDITQSADDTDTGLGSKLPEAQYAPRAEKAESKDIAHSPEDPHPGSRSKLPEAQYAPKAEKEEGKDITHSPEDADIGSRSKLPEPQYAPKAEKGKGKNADIAHSPDNADIGSDSSRELPGSARRVAARVVQKPYIEGNVDLITRTSALGWAWMPAFPDAAVTVEAVLEGIVIGRAVADIERPDLVKWRTGTGRYGFAITFDGPVHGDKAPSVRVHGPHGSIVLPGANQFPAEKKTTSTSKSADIKPQGLHAMVGIEGHVDRLTRYDATGWAWVKSSPNVALLIEAILDGRVIGRTIADQYRADLAAHGKGTGCYGFTVKFEEPIAGDQPATLRALVPLEYSLPGAANLPPKTRADNATRKRGSISTLLQEQASFTVAGPQFEEFDPTILSRASREDGGARPLLLAFYLPQFHAIPENDEFWGRGFTEWRQLPKGLPRFPGHYQPRIPRDLGYYNLEHEAAIRSQCALAQAAGVNGFGYYYYWFNQKRVLDKPLEVFLQSDIDMPFCIIWANENWTRTWDGSESHVLLRQDYAEKDDQALIDDLARHFSDQRYIRLGGRPFFVIYNPRNIPDAQETIARWRTMFVERHKINPLIFMAQTFGENDPRVFGLDGALEFPPHKLADNLPGRLTPDAYSREFAGRVIDYNDLASSSLDCSDPDFPLIKTIVPSWDNDCRRPNRGLSLEGVAPAKYEKWLRALILRAMDKPILGTPIVAINAWNEWAESAYLEPDVYYGSAYLNATARAYVSAMEGYATEAEKLTSSGSRPRVTVILPNYNHARFLPERIRSVMNQSYPPDEIIFLDDCSSDNSLDVARELLSAGSIPFRVVHNNQNSGCVFKQWIKGIELARNPLIWIAETDDYADGDFLKHIVANFDDEAVMVCFGRIACVNEDGAPRNDLAHYFDGLDRFSWSASSVVPAFTAFSHDFAIKNVIPNASGAVFRKPRLSDSEINRLYEYRFAGDWYLYALITRGGSIAYESKARSFFRINKGSTSRSAFFTERHLVEHKMFVDDIRNIYDIDDAVSDAHVDALTVYYEGKPVGELKSDFRTRPEDANGYQRRQSRRVCVAAHNFAVGGGELVPLALANVLRDRGHQITYLVMERMTVGERSVRSRLRPDIPVVYWDEVAPRFGDFLASYGIEIINSHNVSVEYQLYLRDVHMNIPYVASLHGGYETVPHLLTAEFIGFVKKRVGAWLALAEKNQQILVSNGVPPDKFRESFNAIPVQTDYIDRDAFRDEHRIAKDAFVFVICSRAIPEKGWQVAIDVVTEVARVANRPMHLVLIGDGPAADELKAANSHLKHLTFMGHVDNPIRYFKCFDMGIFPSTFAGETFPLFLIECLHAGLPVLSTDIGEIPNIMGTEVRLRPGAMVSFRAEPIQMRRDMITFVKRMVANKGLYERMCANAREISRRFSMESLADLYEGVFTELIDDPVAPQRVDSNSMGGKIAVRG